MRIIVAFLISLISVNSCFVSSVSAKDLDPQETCGSPNEEISDELKGNLDAKAQTLARLGSAQFSGELQKTRKEIMLRENRSDASRLIHYLIVVSCRVVVSDDKLTTDEKLSRIATLKDISQQPYDQSEKQKDDQRQAQTYGRRLNKGMLIAIRESRAGGIRFFDPPVDTIMVNKRIFRSDLQFRHPGTYVFRLDKRQQRLRLSCALSDEIRKSARYALRVIADNNQVFEEYYSIGNDPVSNDVDIAGTETLVFDISGSPSGDFMLFYCNDELGY